MRTRLRRSGIIATPAVGNTPDRRKDESYCLRLIIVLVRFLTKNEFSYCRDCYQRIFSKVCRQCEAVIQPGSGELTLTGEGEGEGETHYHRECFHCVVCQLSLLEAEYVRLAGGLHCSQCAGPATCWQCGGEIRPGERRLGRRERRWHPACLQCGHCSSPLAGLGFSWRQDQPYCLTCLNLLFSRPCEGCPRPIRNIVIIGSSDSLTDPVVSESGGERFVSLAGLAWHTSCFLCSVCSTSLVDRGFIAEARQVFCQDCAQHRAAQ